MSIEYIEDLHGRIIKDIKITYSEEYGDIIHFFTKCNKLFVMYHYFDCSESVYLEDYDGIYNLIGKEIIEFKEVYDERENDDDGILAYTFYHIDTLDDSVCIRWNGTSNGCYSVGVSIVEIKSPVDVAYDELYTYSRRRIASFIKKKDIDKNIVLEVFMRYVKDADERDKTNTEDDGFHINSYRYLLASTNEYIENKVDEIINLWKRECGLE